MQNAIATFKFKQKLSVRTIDKDGAVWFVATDVAKAVGYKTATAMTRMLDAEEKGYSNLNTLGGKQRLEIVNESGLYHALFKSQKREAKPFRKWVTAEVLPSIRRTGQYQMTPATPVDVPERLRIACLEDAVLRLRPDWRKILRYRNLGLSQKEIGLLLRVSPQMVRDRLIEMSGCGLVSYSPNPALSERARKTNAVRWSKYRALADARQPQLPLEG
ncbi:MAG: hypothetical protein FWC38_00500 [Proteobacteria bacterium]|nr:hypothetical protein [Pseudomonadota bacterium]MCL2306722.1 hypothetical protein [Pseudomonadota bacterium]